MIHQLQFTNISKIYLKYKLEILQDPLLYWAQIVLGDVTVQR